MTLENRVISIIKKNMGKELDITSTSRLIEDLNIDSFDRIMIIAALEDEFAINVDMEDFSDVILVSDIVKRLEKHIGQV